MAKRDYEQHKKRTADDQSAQSRDGRDIGDLDAVCDQARRDKCERDFRAYCETYHAPLFTLAWSDDHLAVIKKFEETVLHGGRFALAMPRGSGKSTLAECAAEWALVYGHAEFVALIGADEDHAINMLESIKIELETNDVLAEDFPEVCGPIHSLEGIANRCKGQLHNGERTRITWTEKCIVLPTIKGSKASGSVIKTRGITGRIRGLKHKRADGTAIRPTLVVLDDPQTDESAGSEKENRKRIRALTKTILKLAGPGETIALVMPCTVIFADDMADQILNVEKHPEFNGSRTKLLYDFPSKMSAWQQYLEVLKTAPGGDQKRKRAATKFYKSNRKEMTKGSRVAWKERYEPWQLDGLQFAMTEYLEDPEGFAAEYQNEPLETDQAGELLEVDQIMARLHPQSRTVIPLEASKLTAFIDVHDHILYWAVVAWNDSNASGFVVDYGTYPDQALWRFEHTKVTKTLRRKHPGSGREGAIYQGLTANVADLQGRTYRREDDATLAIELLMIDEGHETDIVRRVVREAGRGVLPCRGKTQVTSTPLNDWKKQPGEQVGNHWRLRSDSRSTKTRSRFVLADVNYWKTWLHSRFSTGLGDSGSMTLFSEPDRKTKLHRALRHQMLAEHCRAERLEKHTIDGREVDGWKLPSHRPDNHFFDCLVGCCIAASIQGVTLVSDKPATVRRRKRIKIKT